MDEIVLRALLKWPNVPSVYGWLRLDRRGRWSIRMPSVPTAPGAADAAPRFERIVNPAMIEFIGRNYTRDAEGRYFFQNGPQRVFVTLEYTPWIYRGSIPQGSTSWRTPVPRRARHGKRIWMTGAGLSSCARRARAPCSTVTSRQ